MFFDPEGVVCENLQYIRPLQGRDFLANLIL